MALSVSQSPEARVGVVMRVAQCGLAIVGESDSPKQCMDVVGRTDCRQQTSDVAGNVVLHAYGWEAARPVWIV